MYCKNTRTSRVTPEQSAFYEHVNPGWLFQIQSEFLHVLSRFTEPGNEKVGYAVSTHLQHEKIATKTTSTWIGSFFIDMFPSNLQVPILYTCVERQCGLKWNTGPLFLDFERYLNVFLPLPSSDEKNWWYCQFKDPLSGVQEIRDEGCDQGLSHVWCTSYNLSTVFSRARTDF